MTSHLTTYDQNTLEKEWIGWGNQMFRNVLLTVFPEFALTCIDSDVPAITSVLRGLDSGDPPPKIQFHCAYGDHDFYSPIATLAEEASRLIHDRNNAVGREAMKHDTCIFATRLHDLADWDDRKNCRLSRAMPRPSSMSS